MTTATEQAEKEQAKELPHAAIHAAMKSFTMAYAPKDRDALGDFMADHNHLMMLVHREVMQQYEEVIAASMTTLATVKSLQVEDFKAVNPSLINAGLLRSILGYHQYQKYVKLLVLEQPNLGLDQLSDVHFLISRAQDFDKGNFTDLGCYNVVAYGKHLPKAGFCIVLHDPEKG